MSGIQGVVASALSSIQTTQRSFARSSRAISSRRSQDSIAINSSQVLSRAAAQANTGARNGRLAQAKSDMAYEGLNQSREVLGRMQELAVRASSGDLSAGDRAAIQAEAEQLGSELSSILDNGQYNGEPLYDGGSSSTRIDGAVSLVNADGAAIQAPLAGIDLSSQAGATAALGQIESAQEALALEQTKVANQSAALGRSIQVAEGKSASLASSSAEIGSADIAREVAQATANQVQQSAATKVLKTFQEMEKERVHELLK